MKSIILQYKELSYEFLREFHLSHTLTNTLFFISNLLFLGIVCLVFYFLVRRIIFRVAKSLIHRSKSKHDDVFIEKRAFRPFAHLMIAILLNSMLPVLFKMDEDFRAILKTTMIVYSILVFMVVIKRILFSVEQIALTNPKYQHKPIGSYIQMGILILYIISGVLVLSVLVGRSPMAIITAFGAGMAIIILVFKDTILGLIASIQLSVNDMVRLGDWISVNGYDADGDLIEINLMSVKIRNSDKTVTNVPTYALISNGFKNWREMQDLGIRRLTHNILIDVKTIQEVKTDFVLSLKEKGFFSGEVDALKWKTTKDYQHDKVTSITNLGLFRKYIEEYLLEHPGISDTYIVVRHLQQTGEGLPLGVYAFSNDVNFKPLQQVQADIFEHFYAVIKEFNLDVYQNYTSKPLFN